MGQSEPFFIDVGAPVSGSAPSLDVPYGISDRGGPPVSSDLIYATQSEIVTVRVTIDLTHTYIGDLLVELISPTGTHVRLHDHTGGSQNDIIGTYGVDLSPFESLSAFSGEMSSGSWTLEVLDDAAGDDGVLNAWSLEIDGRPAELLPPEMKFRRVEAQSGATRFEWWTYPGLTSYRVYRSTDPSQAAAFVNVTLEDGDPTDTVFDDVSVDPVSYFLVTGVSPNGEGPMGHFGP
jgi:subtilisin-like proprotein convertase family protein